MRTELPTALRCRCQFRAALLYRGMLEYCTVSCPGDIIVQNAGNFKRVVFIYLGHKEPVEKVISQLLFNELVEIC